MKENFEAPEIEIVIFENEDVVTASGETPFVPAEPTQP